MTETTQKPSPRIHPLRLIIAGMLLLAMMGTALWLVVQLSGAQGPSGGVAISIPRDARSIALDGSNGEPLTINNLREGRQYTLLTFGYTHCPDVCPLTLTEFLRVRRDLTDTEAERMNFVFVSVDGQRDTPELLNRYVTRFDEAFLGASTQDDSVMRQFDDAFKVFYDIREVENTAAPYLVDHTATIFLVGPSGDVVTSYPFGTPAAEIASDIRDRL
ncbi:MAG: SCO family protein [Chloroflexota bacterium]